MSGVRSPREGRYRNASEVGTYLFCQRAWMLERQGAPSEREPERTAGTAYHQRHGERVDTARRAGAVSNGALLAAIVLLLLGLWALIR